jgi:fungal nitric oxide reductase
MPISMFKLSRHDIYVNKLNRELLKYLDKLVNQRLTAPKDDLISKLAVEQVKPGHIDKSDAVQIAFLLLVAGNATMVNMIALVSFLIA